MPYGYLITAVLATLCTALAFTAPRRPFVLGLASLLLGLVYNEAPPAVFVVLAASALSSLGQPGMGSAAGWGATGLLVLTGAGLIALALRGLRTEKAVSRALDAELGADWRAAIDPALAPRPRGQAAFRLFAVPWLFGRRGVERIANLSYGEAGMRNRLDLYRSRVRPATGPVLIHLHGGALMRGRKNIEARTLLYRLAAEGWLCVSANYRLRPAVGFPEHLIDVKKAIAWVREHASDYGGDAGALFLAGTSVGGQLAALAGLTPNDPRFQPGFEDADTSVTAVVYLSGYYGDPDDAEEPDDAGDAGNGEHPAAPYSPFARGGAGAPPFLIAHGTRDSLVPVRDARAFADRLRRASSNPVVLCELPGGQHSFDRFHSPRFNAVVDAVRDFAAWLLSRDSGPAEG